MIEIMANINTFVMSKVSGISNINEDFFVSDTEDETICRHDVAPLIDRRYLTGNYWAAFNFSYYTRASDPMTARQVQESIMEALSLDNFSELLGLVEGRMTILTRPTPVVREEDGSVTYTSSYRLVYFVEV